MIGIFIPEMGKHRDRERGDMGRRIKGELKRRDVGRSLKTGRHKIPRAQRVSQEGEKQGASSRHWSKGLGRQERTKQLARTGAGGVQGPELNSRMGLTHRQPRG